MSATYCVTIGNCTLYHGDCLEVMPTLDAKSIDAVVTDPPYGIGFAAQPTKWQRRAGSQPKDWDDIAPDVSWLINAAPTVAIWGGNYYTLPVSRGWLAWVKPDAPPSMGTVEMAWTNIDRPARHVWHSISAINRERVGHPTQKPCKIMTETILFCGIPDHVAICDPFMGAGTTGVAAIQLNNHFIGIEKERKYFDIACERIERAVEDQQSRLC